MKLSGDNKKLAENKLILLYTIHKLDMPISNLQLTKLIMESNFMNYFFLQQFLNELCDDKFISSQIIDGKTFYLITDTGKKTLNYLSDLILPIVKERIDSTINSSKKKIRNETLITADFIPESEHEYIVSCRVSEDNFTLIDLKVTVGTKSDARIICENWNKHSQSIYSEIIESLIKTRE
jgi:predicted transcriptional regulator